MKEVIEKRVSERLIDVDEVAAIFGISVRSVWRNVERGEIPGPVKIGGRTKFVLSEMLNRLEELKQQRDENTR